ncbi:MAG: hypothetical protein AAGI70_13160 [Pseudomonadota bacterium]
MSWPLLTWRLLRVPFVLVVAWWVAFALLPVTTLPVGVSPGLSEGVGVIFFTVVALGLVWSPWLPAPRRERLALSGALPLVMGLRLLAEYGGSGSVIAIVLNEYVLVLWIAAAGILAVKAQSFGEVDPAEPDEVARFTDQVLPHVEDQRAAAIAHHLVRESERMRRLSFLTLGGVAALMSIAVTVVLFAGFITSIDLSGTLSPVEKASRYADTARDTERQLTLERYLLNRLVTGIKDGKLLEENGLSFNSAEIRGIANRYQDILQNLAPAGMDISRTRAGSFVRVVQDRGTPNDGMAVLSFIQGEVDRATETLAQVDRELTRAAEEVTEAEKLLRDARAKEIQGETSGERQLATEALIASAVTRFGVIVVLMFLAQALINLYRYALRLSAFYRSRAMMMALTEGDAKALEAVAKTLSADHVSLGREPRSPKRMPNASPKSPRI